MRKLFAPISVLILATTLFGQTGPSGAADPARTDTARADSPDYGWIGLLGLVGLAGLRRRRDTGEVRTMDRSELRRAG